MQLSGKKVLLLTSSSLFTLLSFPYLAYANESSVSVVNKVNVSNSTSGGSSTGRTDIVIECNGVKKEYHSDKAENVTLNCDDSTSGTVKSEVNVRTGSSNSAKVSPSQTEEEKEKAKDETKKLKEEVKKEKEKMKEERRDLFEEITQLFREFFKNFHF